MSMSYKIKAHNNMEKYSNHLMQVAVLTQNLKICTIEKNVYKTGDTEN